MKIKDIVEALNRYYLARFPNAKGWFIVKEITEPTLVNAYKKRRAELFYHLPGKNEKVLTVQQIDRCLEGTEEVFNERFMIAFLEEVFNGLEKFDEYEAV